MHDHEYEYKIYEIILGTLYLDSFIIKPPTIKQLLYSCKKYNEAYNNAQEAGVMTVKQMKMWMIESEIIPPSYDGEVIMIQKEIDDNKASLYKSRKNKQNIKIFTKNIKELKKKLQLYNQKNELYYHNTCEFIAQTEKLAFLLRNTTYKNKKLYKFTNDLDYVLSLWQGTFLNESNIRSLARNNIWRNIWSNHKITHNKLFQNKPNEDLTYNQKNLLTWSKIYDNVFESINCPEDFVINNDDMLDGWFVCEQREREKEKIEKDFDISKHKNSDGKSAHFIMADNIQEAKEIYALNK